MQQIDENGGTNRWNVVFGVLKFVYIKLILYLCTRFVKQSCQLIFSVARLTLRPRMSTAKESKKEQAEKK